MPHDDIVEPLPPVLWRRLSHKQHFLWCGLLQHALDVACAHDMAADVDVGGAAGGTQGCQARPQALLLLRLLLSELLQQWSPLVVQQVVCCLLGLYELHKYLQWLQAVGVVEVSTSRIYRCRSANNQTEPQTAHDGVKL
jgi:hypothetical protein